MFTYQLRPYSGNCKRLTLDEVKKLLEDNGYYAPDVVYDAREAAENRTTHRSEVFTKQGIIIIRHTNMEAVNG